MFLRRASNGRPGSVAAIMDVIFEHSLDLRQEKGKYLFLFIHSSLLLFNL